MFATIEELKRTFESKTLSDYPKLTKIKVVFNNQSKIIEIPTEKIFRSGSWLSRDFAGINFLKIESYLRANKIKFHTYTV